MEIDAVKLPLRHCVQDAVAICADLATSTARERRARLDRIRTGSASFSALRTAVSVASLHDRLFRERSWCESDTERTAADDHDLLTYIAWFVDQQFSAQKSNQLDEVIFEASWREFVIQISRVTLVWTFIIPLHNVGLIEHTDELVVSPRLRIIRLSEADREKYRGRLDPLHAPLAAAKLTMTAPRQVIVSPASAADVAERLVAAMRCTCTHKVWAEKVSISADDPFDSHSLSWQPFEWTGYRGISLAPLDDFVILSADSVAQIAALYHLFALREHEQTSFQDVLRRFNVASERPNHQDMLLDCWVALEKLLLPEHGRVKGAPAARRLARLLASPDPNAITEIVRRSYRLRSQIVHGSAGRDEAQLYRVAWETYELLKRSLVAAALVPPPFDPSSLD